MGGESTKLTLTYYAGGKIVGLESERPLTNNLPANTTFIETDTLLEYIWDGVATWNIIGTSPFSPDSIPNLEHWYDTSDNSTLTPSSGLISNWADKKGTEDAEQSTGGDQPTLEIAGQNGLDVLDMAGSKFMVTGAGSVLIPLPVSLYFVISTPVTGGGTKRPLQGNEGTFAQYLTAGNANIWDLNMGSNIGFTEAFVVGSWHIWKLEIPSGGVSASMTVDNIIEVTGNVGSTRAVDGISFGATNAGNDPSSNKFAELLLYSRVLSGSEDAEVTTYLSDKWGIAI